MKIDILKWPCDAMAHRAFARQTLQNQLAPTAFHRSSAARQRKTAQLCQRPGRAKTCQHCALDCPPLPLPDIAGHLCNVRIPIRVWNLSPGRCGSCRGPNSLMLCRCSVVSGIMVTVCTCCLDNKEENLSGGSLQTAHDHCTFKLVTASRSSVVLVAEQSRSRSRQHVAEGQSIRRRCATPSAATFITVAQGGQGTHCFQTTMPLSQCTYRL